MNTSVIELKKKQKTKVGTAIDSDLLESVKEVCKKENINLSDAIEYGLKIFLKEIKND